MTHPQWGWTLRPAPQYLRLLVRLALVLLFAAAFLSLILPVMAAPGDLDPTFGAPRGAV